MIEEIVSVFIDYVICDDNDEWCGVADDAPDYVKEAYSKFENDMKKLEEEGRFV